MAPDCLRAWNVALFALACACATADPPPEPTGETPTVVLTAPESEGARVARAHYQGGRNASMSNRHEESVAQLREAIRLAEGDPTAHDVLALAQSGLAAELEWRGHYKEAHALRIATLENRRSAFGPGSREVALAEMGLALLYKDVGRFDDAATHAESAYPVLAKRADSIHGAALCLWTRGVVQREQGRLAEAEASLRKALVVLASLGRAGGIYAHPIQNDLAQTLSGLGRLQEAEEMHRTAIRLSRKMVRNESPDIGRHERDLGRLLHRQGRTEEAESLLRSALRNFEEAFGEEHFEVRESLLALAALLENHGDGAGAARLRERAASLPTKEGL